MKVVNVIGNGDNHALYEREKRHGLNLTCNVAPFRVENHFATCIVDFKFMRALTKGEVDVAGEWILGFRPKMWMDKNPGFYMRRAHQVKEFYLDLPKYSMMPGEGPGQGYTNWSCGHMAVHYAARKMKADEINIFGFDSIFDFNLRSTSDFIINSDRDNMNTNRLASNWRPVFRGIFNEFPNTQFILHHTHDNYKIYNSKEDVPDNVTTIVYSK